MMYDCNLKHTGLLGWPILSLLLVFSFITRPIFFECLSLHRQIRGDIAKGDSAELKALFNRAEQRLAILGTLANAAPFVGLLGTVIGIIRAFHTISQASGAGGGMTLVAGGISEALVSTAAGLAVAIPASMLFNYFTFKNEKLMETAGMES